MYSNNLKFVVFACSLSVQNWYIFLCLSLNTHALVATSLGDELVNTYNICTSNSQDYLKELPHEDVVLIKKFQKKHTNQEDIWFPLIRKFLAKLFYNVSKF